MQRPVGKHIRCHMAVGLLAVSALLAGCSDGKADEVEGGGTEPSAESTTTSTTPGTARAKSRSTTTTTSSSAKKPGDSQAATGSQAPGAPGQEVDTTTLTMEISLTLKEKCVRPGGTQTITVHAPFTSGVGYDTYYADGTSGVQEGFHGGNKAGWADESNTYTDTWVVAATAPPGQATVVVMAVHDLYGRGETGDLFAVADPLGLCDPVKYSNE